MTTSQASDTQALRFVKEVTTGQDALTDMTG